MHGQITIDSGPLRGVALSVSRRRRLRWVVARQVRAWRPRRPDRYLRPAGTA